MVSPNPPVRPTRVPLDVQLVSLYPERDGELTGKLQKMMDWFLHTIAFGLDNDGRPVSPNPLLTQPHTRVLQTISRRNTLQERKLFLSRMRTRGGPLTRVTHLHGLCNLKSRASRRSCGMTT